MKYQTLIITGLLLLTSSLCNAADAPLSKPVFSSIPTHSSNSWFIKKANPGQTIEDSLTIKNLSDKPITLNLTFREMKGTPENAQIIESENFQNLGNWISLENSKIDLDAHQSKDLSFQIKIPADANLSKYQGTLLVSYSDPSNSAFNFVTRLGNRVYLDVTNQKIIQANSFNLDITPLQIAFLFLSSAGLVYGLRKTNEQHEKI